ncbi:PIN domain-containing protein [Fimbriimonas ginsengisoli]|nr:PIN domain-containing protein [Fimbriimonas ginsengisoli]
MLDTNVLRSDPKRKSAPFSVLGKLVQLDEVTIHLPDVASREFESHLVENHCAPLRNAVANARNAMKSAGSHFPTDPAPIVDTLQSAVDGAARWITDEYAAWLKSHKVVLHSVAYHHGANVVDGYFAGHSPFKHIKEREGFPDGFIFEVVKDLATTHKPLHIVTADKALKKAVGNLAEVSQHASLETFVKLPDFHKALVGPELMPSLRKLENEILALVHSKMEAEVEGYSFSSRLIPSDDNEAVISMYDVPADIGLDWEEVEDFGGGVVAIPFSFEMEVYADFYIYKSDYYTMGLDEMESISVTSYDNDHYYEGQRIMNVEVTGRIAVTVDLDKFDGSPESLEKLLTEDSVEVSEIEDVIATGEDEEW